MKTVIDRYTFSAADKTIAFTDFAVINPARVLLITNTTDNVVIYNFAGGATLGGTVAGNVLTLTYDTTSMENTDALLVIYDAPGAVSPEQPTADAGTAALLRSLLTEQRLTNLLLVTGFAIRDDLDELRNSVCDDA